MKVKILKYGNKICGETRKADFLKYFGREIEVTRIISFGACNFACPYCKRDCQLVDDKGNAIRAVEVDLEEDVFPIINKAIANGERIRLSGGDPVMFPKASLKIAQYVWEKYGQKISIAHNGSGQKFARDLAPYLEYAAIDLKGHSGSELSFRAGIPERVGGRMLDSTLKVQDILAQDGVLVDIRTPIFKETGLDELIEMASLISKTGTKNKFWTLRKYNPVKWVDWESANEQTLYDNAQTVSKMFPELPIGLKTKWSGNKEFVIFKAGKRIF